MIAIMSKRCVEDYYEKLNEKLNARLCTLIGYRHVEDDTNKQNANGSSTR